MALEAGRRSDECVTYLQWRQSADVMTLALVIVGLVIIVAAIVGWACLNVARRMTPGGRHRA